MPPKRHSRKGLPWTLRELALLGKLPDSVLAHRFGRTIQGVNSERERRRIRLQAAPRRWTVNETKLLGRFPDRELARRFRRPKNQVRGERIRLRIAPYLAHKGRAWKRAEDKILGTARDWQIARRLNRSILSVRGHAQRPTWTRPWLTTVMYRRLICSLKGQSFLLECVHAADRLLTGRRGPAREANSRRFR
jgi:hypothetical protein